MEKLSTYTNFLLHFVSKYKIFGSFWQLFRFNIMLNVKIRYYSVNIWSLLTIELLFNNLAKNHLSSVFNRSCDIIIVQKLSFLCITSWDKAY